HAVLSGQHAAHLHAQAKDVRTKALGLLELIALAGIVEDQRMQIAIARMEDVGDRQSAGLRHLADTAEYLRQAVARNGSVHAVVIRRDAPDRRERRLASRPELQPLALAAGDAQ